MHSPRQLNPSETAMFTADIARLPVEHQADVALTWRERCVAIMQEHMNPLADGLAVATAGIYTGAIGWWDGYNEAQRDKLIVEWQQVTAPGLGVDANAVQTPFQDVYDANGQLVHKRVSDPRDWLRMNRTLYPTVGLALTAVIGVGGPTYNRFFLAPAVGGVGYAVGSWFRDMAYKAAQKKAMASANGGNGNGVNGGGTGNGADAGNGTANGNGGEGNPYGGYPRAA